MRKIIYLIMLLVLLGNTYAWGNYEQSRGNQFILENLWYYEDLGVGFTWKYALANAEDMIPFPADSCRTDTVTLCSPLDLFCFDFDREVCDTEDGDFLFKDGELIKYEYGTNADITQYYLPYTIHDCYISCDTNKNEITRFNMPHVDSTGSSVENPYTNEWFFSEFHVCLYDSSYTGKDVEILVGCNIVPNKYWVEDNPQLESDADYTLIIHPDPIFDMFYNNSEVFNLCEEIPYNCETYTIDIDSCTWEQREYHISIGDYEEYCLHEETRNTCPGYGTGNEIWGDQYFTCSNVIKDAFTFTINIPSEGDLLDRIGDSENEGDKDTEDDSVNIGGGDDDTEMERQDEFQKEVSIERKKDITLRNFVFLTEVFFSFVLLVFYIFEIAMVIFVFTVWIPSVILFFVKIVKKFGKVK